MVVARSVEPSSIDFESYQYIPPIVPTKILTDPEELDRQLLQNGYTTCFNFKSEQSPLEEKSEVELSTKSDIINCETSFNPVEKLEAIRKVKSVDLCGFTNCNNNESNNINNNNNNYSSNTSTSKFESPDSESPVSTSQIIVIPVDLEYDIPETKKISVVLGKNEFGLGITIAGYVCEREDLNGIFVKNLTEGSEAHKCQLIHINDRIIEVDGKPLQELTNHEAVKLLKETGEVVNLTFERYLRGPKYEQLQEALASHERRAKSPPSPSVKTLSWIPIDNTEVISIEPEQDSVNSVQSEVYEQIPENREIFIEEDFEANPEDDLETTIKQKWEGMLGTEANIVVANLTKLKGLGISLEGTVDVEGGIELRPRHFIRSILPEGPVGQNGKLSPGDEILEVNGQKLLGLKHVEVVKILRELPNAVRLVCSRKDIDNRVINTSQDREAFEQRNILGGSLKNLLPQPEPRLIKAISDSSLHTSSTVTVTDDPSSLKKEKSRSLETTNVAMWSEEVEYVELQKADRGLGFSILDYQDPLDPKSTIIVVRGLVPHGPAESDGRITPGDRLISVNETLIKNYTLDQAVQALKGTLPGIVRLGISKPLPCSRTSGTISSSNT
ncbi:patj homolog isoform X2 [Anthonomus grandis grandis]|nr:patj homolog isoform X2 [Anthonomus grandis grandis]XP_050316405.1 patj homolog isoform X2 [Anthonomus grandis grandis]XP_050316406.1 patj homolog isoform X2 [Anthonomus grandis grandis]